MPIYHLEGISRYSDPAHHEADHTLLPGCGGLLRQVLPSRILLLSRQGGYVSKHRKRERVMPFVGLPGWPKPVGLSLRRGWCRVAPAGACTDGTRRCRWQRAPLRSNERLAIVRLVRCVTRSSLHAVLFSIGQSLLRLTRQVPRVFCAAIVGSSWLAFPSTTCNGCAASPAVRKALFRVPASGVRN